MNRRIFLMSAAAAAVNCSRSKPRLNVYNWSDYVAPDTISNFENEFGVQVRYGTYEGALEMLAKVMGGNSGWDIVFPPTDFVQPMVEMGLLAPLHHELLPHLGSLSEMFQHPPWDQRVEWSVAYMQGTTGIVYQKELGIKSWADMWDPRLAGKMTMIDDPVEVLGACLKKIGASLNAADPALLRRSAAEAIAQKRLLRAYLNAEVRDQLVSGDVAVAQAWAVTAGQAIAAAPAKLAYAFPSEGFDHYADTVAILRESRRAELAHQFIDYLLRPEVAARIVVTTQTATANEAALRFLPVQLRENPVLYPSAEILARSEWFEAPSPASQKLRDRLWTEIKSS